MPARKLTSAFCDAAKPEQGRQIAFPDHDVRGLELRVSGENRKTWSYRYRTREGRQGRLTIGLHSAEFGLREARQAARKMQVIVDSGGDPGLELRIAKVAASTEHLKTFADLARVYFAETEAGRYRPKRRTSLTNERAVYRVHIERALGRLPLESVSRRVVKGALLRMLEGGVTSQAVRAQAVIRQMLSYAVAEERLAFNPIKDLPPVAPSNARARIYSDGEMRAIWAGVAAPERLKIPAAIAERRRDGERVRISQAMRIAIQLVFLLLQRRTEVLGMKRSELALDQGVWIIPAARTKGKRNHAVPLSPWAVDLIRAAIALNGNLKTDYVFPGRTDPAKSMNSSSMNWAFNSVLWACEIEDGTIHDIRRSGSTLMTSERLCVSPFIRSKILGHSDAGGGSQVTATHYDANSYIAEKRAALEQWQRLLRQIVVGEHQAPLRFDIASPIVGGFLPHRSAVRSRPQLPMISIA